MTDRISTRFMIISDTHNATFGDDAVSFPLPFPKVDVLLHCGDLTHRGGAIAYSENVLKMLASIDAELKLVIAGNHDRDLDKVYWAKYISRYSRCTMEDHEEAVEVMTGPLAQAAGVTYLEEGTYTFTLSNGAKFTIYASPYQPEFCDWAFPYARNQDRFNTADQIEPGSDLVSIAENPIPNFGHVDVVMTHGPPQDILDTTLRGGNQGCRNLMRAISRARPLLHCFGHLHEGYGMKVVKWKQDNLDSGTVAEIASEIEQTNSFPEAINYEVPKHGMHTAFVNAAIMDIRYKPVNAPWIINLNLPREDGTC